MGVGYEYGMVYWVSVWERETMTVTSYRKRVTSGVEKLHGREGKRKENGVRAYRIRVGQG